MTQWLPNSNQKPRDHKILIRSSKFLYVFNLRQGAILIAVQHIALSACALILLLVGIAHAQEMMDMLNADMEDNAEREGSILIEEEDLNLLRDIPFEATNNQQKFKVAQNLAMMMVFFLYGSLVGTAIYLVFCVALFYGAAKNKKEYILPWIFCTVLIFGIMIAIIVIGDNSYIITKIFGGETLYRFGCFVLLLGHFYCIIAVMKYVKELKVTRPKNKLSESTLQLNIDTNEKNMLIAKESIKISLNDPLITGPVSQINHV